MDLSLFAKIPLVFRCVNFIHNCGDSGNNFLKKKEILEENYGQQSIYYCHVAHFSVHLVYLCFLPCSLCFAAAAVEVNKHWVCEGGDHSFKSV